jgi:trehalose 6-phosphate phosphatase
MKILTPGLDLEGFFDRLCHAGSRVLMLDYDGTLAPFDEDRDKAVPFPGVRALLSALLKAGSTRVILVSGRGARDLAKLVGLESLPEIWGSHGLERLMPDNTYSMSPLSETAVIGLTEAEEWVDRQGLAQYCEKKPAGIALHTRGVEPPVALQITDRVLESWSGISLRRGLVVHNFDGGIELRVPHMDKGHAVRTVLAEIKENSVVAYMGDDLTDEDALLAVKGRGLGVLVREAPRKTAADIWIRPPNELLDFLARWLEAGEGSK